LPFRTGVAGTLEAEAAAGAAQAWGEARARVVKRRARSAVRMVGGLWEVVLLLVDDVEKAKTLDICSALKLFEGAMERHAAEGFFYRELAFQYVAQYVLMKFHLGVH
jgi:hypothetical protein